MALPVNISTLLNGNSVEWERLELKKGWNEESILHTICAFANDINNWNGGYIVIGIEEKNGKPVLPPFGLEDNQLDSIQKKLIELSKRLHPNYFPVIEPVRYQDKNIIILWCPGGDYRPYSAPENIGKKAQKFYYARRGSQTIKANKEEERTLLELTAKVPFDDRINHHATIENLSLPLIRIFLQKVGSKLFEDAHKIEFIELCKQMQIVKGSTEYLRPTNVGLLMFSENPQQFFPGAYIDIAIYKDNDGIEYTQKEFKGSIYQQLEKALDFINTNVIKETVKKQPGIAEAKRFYNYPFEAIEEALANAVYHRSYEHENQIEVHIRLNKIEIISYPGALPPVDNEALKKERIVARVYRNRRIGNFLKELNLTEAKGTGIPTIRKAMKENGSPQPVFMMDKDKMYFLCVLEIHPESMDNIKENTILTFCQSPKSRKEILTDLLKLSNQTFNFNKNILPLIEKGWLNYTIPENINSKNQKYIITKKGKDLLKDKLTK
ncbi:MAG: putative DNA binding domain-containing protein [Bacteroidales bacterium]|nr:putative DNA binding domain-containing protein [Bacteroidales bacterium]